MTTGCASSAAPPPTPGHPLGPGAALVPAESHRSSPLPRDRARCCGRTCSPAGLGGSSSAHPSGLAGTRRALLSARNPELSAPPARPRRSCPAGTDFSSPHIPSGKRHFRGTCSQRPRVGGEPSPAAEPAQHSPLAAALSPQAATKPNYKLTILLNINKLYIII